MDQGKTLSFLKLPQLLLRNAFLVYFVMICSNDLWSQSTVKYPAAFNQFMKSYPLINPAASCSETKFELQTGTQVYAYPYNEIRNTYFNALFQLNKSAGSQSTRHITGISILSEKEGDPIHRTRFYGIYALHIPLNQRTTLGSGVSFGLVNFNMSGTTQNTTGSATNMDASAGLWLKGEKYHAGISLNQITGLKLRPIHEQFWLRRYSVVNAGRTFYLSKNLNLDLLFMMRYFQSNKKDINIAAMLHISEYIVTGLNYRYHSSVSIMAGLQRIKVWKNELEFMLSYTVPTSWRSNTKVLVYEVTVNFKMFTDED